MEIDIDLLVMPGAEEISWTYEESMQRRLTARDSVHAVTLRVPIDLAVHELLPGGKPPRDPARKMYHLAGMICEAVEQSLAKKLGDETTKKQDS